MAHKTENPAALAGACRVESPELSKATGNKVDNSPDCLSYQASYVSARYCLSPCIARLICQLAEIGGRLA